MTDSVNTFRCKYGSLFGPPFTNTLSPGLPRLQMETGNSVWAPDSLNEKTDIPGTGKCNGLLPHPAHITLNNIELQTAGPVLSVKPAGAAWKVTSLA